MSLQVDAATTTPIPSARREHPRWHLDAAWWPVLSSVALLIGMAGLGGWAYTGLLSPQVMVNLLIDNGFLLIVAVGMSFVILTGGIDLSVGSVVALSTMTAAALLERWHVPVVWVVAMVLTGGTLLGGVQGWLIHRFRLQPFIVTLAGMFLARGLCYVISVDSIAITDPSFTAWSQARLDLPGDVASISPTALVALMVLAAATLAAHFTAFGRCVYAVGGSEQAALLMGLPVGRTVTGVYAISGACAALGGLVFSADMLSGYGLHAVGLELDAIAAVVIGGTLLSGGSGLMLGALCGVLVLGLIQTLIMFDGSLSAWWTRIVIGALLFFFCGMQRVVQRRR
jgi:galactofuranose transport system permease protein